MFKISQIPLFRTSFCILHCYWWIITFVFIGNVVVINTSVVI